jgi:phospholipid/cholesterol/gamma-HCH transport system permease protein
VISSTTETKERIVTLPEQCNREWVASCGLIPPEEGVTLVLDFSQTTRIDSAGICFIRLFHSRCEKGGGRLVIRNIKPGILKSLQAWNTATDNEGKIEPRHSFESRMIQVQETFWKLKDTVIQALSVLVEMLYWGTLGALKRHDYRKGCLGEQMYQLGYKAFGIVGLLSFLIGLVLALQTAMQLRTYGAGVFLGSLIGITMVRELGPLLTAIILAGRTGSATTAEIATMAVNEELDALQIMGINPVQFVIVPKFWAISLTMPLLSILATTAGILGGYLVAIFYLDLTTSLFWSELAKSLSVKDCVQNFVKSLIFSWLIIWIGSFYGLRVRGGAEAVGRETTASVVTGIFIIIIADAMFSFIF